MLDLLRTIVGGLVFVVTTLAPGSAEARQLEVGALAQPRPIARRQGDGETQAGPRPFVRTELYFGTATPEGVLTEEEFRAFVDQHVTSRFPGGLTIVRADGQFTNDAGDMVKEQSYVVVLMYQQKDLAEGHRRIERIRTLYRKQFGQESVLRVDYPFVVWVSY